LSQGEGQHTSFAQRPQRLQIRKGSLEAS